MDYKNTLHMPDTLFEMRGNLPTKEPKFLEQWEKEDHYHKILEKNQGNIPFILHDGPPYANGNLHAGTAMNRIIKDIIVRSKAMAGFYTPFFPGWDTHGLPIENAVQKLGLDRKKVTAKEFREKCEEYARGQLATQMATEKRLGQVADYEHPYISLNKEFEARQVRSFAKMALDGMIYQGLKPIYWSPYNETAIADSEIVYFDRKDPTIFVAFDVKDGNGILQGDEKFVIWTTTPWTMPANLAICLRPDFTYAVVDTEKGKLIVLKSLVDSLMDKFALTNNGIVAEYKGKDLEYITCKHPFLDKESLIICGTHVTDEDGTGCVHTAPGHGADDFYVGQKYGLQAFCPVDEKGNMTAEAGDFLAGLHVFDANKVVIDKLEELGCLLKTEWIEHSYPHDDRLKKPVIFRATVQWFASIEQIKPQLLEVIKSVNWLNSFGEVRITNMIKDRKDWCISRQRLWGVPIPIIYNEDGAPIIEKEVFDHIADLFEKYGSNIWFEKEAKDLLPEGYTNQKSPNGKFTKEKDIMDVWFDSGSSWNELIARGYSYPCDLYFEGSDQYRGWFNSSLIVSVANHGVAPYKSVVSHGWVCDSKGEAMHKSIGNVVNPLDIVDKFGADILRLWASSEDFKTDMRIGDSNLKQVSDQYRKVRNTFRFLLGNINPSDFDHHKDMKPFEELEAIDRYIILKLNSLIKDVKNAYDAYDFVAVTSMMTNFMTNELSSYYLDIAKDILYIEAKDSLRRRQVQSVIYECTDVLCRLWSPVLVFTAHEAWTYLGNEEASSVHYVHFPEAKDYPEQEALLASFERANVIRDAVLKALEDARQEKTIGKSLEAHVLLFACKEDQELLKDFLGDEIARWLIVSKFSFADAVETQDDLKVKIVKAEGKVCPRCWNITDTEDEDGLCERCREVLKHVN